MNTEFKDYVDTYVNNFTTHLHAIEYRDEHGERIETAAGLESTYDYMTFLRESRNRMMIVGNGGSAAIAGHEAIDYWRNGGIPTLSFNDGPLLTCISNDFGYEQVFAKTVEMFANEQDLVVCISSSGQSANILNAAKSARKKGCKVMTLSGFKPDNPLRSLGDYNFYVPASEYGFVEMLHLFVLHFLVDKLTKDKGVAVQ